MISFPNDFMWSDNDMFLNIRVRFNSSREIARVIRHHRVDGAVEKAYDERATPA